MAATVTRSRFTVLTVPEKQKAKTTTRAFVEGAGHDYVNGSVYYQLIKAETISLKKEIVVQEIKTGKLIAGTGVREALGLTKDTKNFKFDPEAQEEFKVFVQSTSPQRHVSPGISLLIDNGEDDDDEDEAVEEEPEEKVTPGKRPRRAAAAASKKESPTKVARKDEEDADKKDAKAKTTRGRKGKAAEAAAAEEVPVGESELDDLIKRATRGSEALTKPKGKAAEPAPPIEAPAAAAPVAPVPVVPAAAVEAAPVIVPPPVVGAGDPPGPPAATQLVISFDTTGSMASCIARVKTVVEEMINRLLTNIPNLSIAIIAHGDYCDKNYTYVIKKLDFSRSGSEICEFIRSCGTTGGGDFDECYELVLHETRTKLSWKPDTLKSLVMIGDATPHLPSYPMNELKLDWRVEANLMKEAGIKVYAVRCLSWNESKKFYDELARLTGGHYLELAQFHAIPDFLIAISYREGGMQGELEGFREEIRKREGGNLTRNLRALFSKLAGAGAATDAGEVNEEKADLDAVDPARFQVLDVPRDMPIKDFVALSGAVFKKGMGFYEFTKAEEVQSYKEIVLLDKATGDMFTGDKAREIAGIPSHVPKSKVHPPATDKWVMFIQSTSVNRKLIGGTRFLYEVDKV